MSRGGRRHCGRQSRRRFVSAGHGGEYDDVWRFLGGEVERLGERGGPGDDGRQWRLRARVVTAMRIMACPNGMGAAWSGACSAPPCPGRV